MFYKWTFMQYIQCGVKRPPDRSQAIIIFSSVQSLSRVQLFVMPWIAAHQASLSITNTQSSPTLMSIKSVMLSSLILCQPLLLLPPIPPSIRVFSNESTLHIRRPKYWSLSFSISPSKEIPKLISFRMDWLDLLAVQGTLKSLLQRHSSKASILRRSAFFTAQLSHPYIMGIPKYVVGWQKCRQPGHPICGCCLKWRHSCMTQSLNSDVSLRTELTYRTPSWGWRIRELVGVEKHAASVVKSGVR